MLPLSMTEELLPPRLTLQIQTLVSSIGRVAGKAFGKLAALGKPAPASLRLVRNAVLLLLIAGSAVGSSMCQVNFGRS